MVRLTDRLDITIVVDWDIKPLIKQNKNRMVLPNIDLSTVQKMYSVDPDQAAPWRVVKWAYSPGNKLGGDLGE